MPRASKASRAATPARKAASKSVKAVKSVKVPPVKKSPAKASAQAKKATPKKAAPLKKAPVKKVPAKKAAPLKKAPVKKVSVKKAAPQKTTTKRAVTKTASSKAVPVKKAAPVKKARKVVFDKFMLEQQDLLHAERATYVEQADALKAEADQLAAEMEPGDIQFDDESGEGATATVDRERDLALSAQARQEVEEIDHALGKLKLGTYGICESCGHPIPKARLKAIPHARLCIACKSGGLSRR